MYLQLVAMYRQSRAVVIQLLTCGSILFGYLDLLVSGQDAVFFGAIINIFYF